MQIPAPPGPLSTKGGLKLGPLASLALLLASRGRSFGAGGPENTVIHSLAGPPARRDTSGGPPAGPRPRHVLHFHHIPTA